MKRDRLIDPTGHLRRWATAKGLLRWEQTCHSSTCCCASHDPGYYYVAQTDVSPAVWGWLTARTYWSSGSVHGHGITQWAQEDTRPIRGGPIADACKGICALPYLSEREKGEFCSAAVSAEHWQDASDLAIEARLLNSRREDAAVTRAEQARQEYSRRFIGGSLTAALAAAGL